MKTTKNIMKNSPFLWTGQWTENTEEFSLSNPVVHWGKTAQSCKEHYAVVLLDCLPLKYTVEMFVHITYQAVQGWTLVL